MLPHDEKERNRLDIMNTMIKVVREDRKLLTNCPTDQLRVETSGWEQAPRVLDLGCGTGIWMLEMASVFKNVEFVGVDIHRMGPETLEPNVVYAAPLDYEAQWSMGEKSWDLIHLQMGLGSVSNWQNLYRKVLDHLVPGTGYFESVEIDFEPRSEKGSLPPGKLGEWWRDIKHHYETCNRRLHYDPETKRILESIGFKDVEHKTYLIPLSEWSDNPAQKRAAMWWQVAMGPGEGAGHGLEALSLHTLCAHSGWQPDHVQLYCNDALRQATNPELRAYNLLHIVTARAPGPDER
jgi:SAM-dependent methyltransferase